MTMFRTAVRRPPAGDFAAVVVLRNPRVEADGASREVKAPALQGQHLTLGPPPKGVFDAHRDLEILGSSLNLVISFVAVVIAALSRWNPPIPGNNWGPMRGAWLW